MPSEVEIDKQSGFCAGVIRAIRKAESFLEGEGKRLYSLGAIVHNEAELARLREKGLIILDRDDISDIPDAQGETILIRAHGQPPRVYDQIIDLGFSIIDCTCPVVVNIQKSIRKAYHRLKPLGGRIVIFGKIGHAEVLGLIGQVDSDAVVIENEEQLQAEIRNGRIDLSKNIDIFSQTTMSPVDYERVCESLKSMVKDGAVLTIHNTICSQVASRHEFLEAFAKSHDVIIFVSGKTSSNGKVLCELCKSVNIRTYHVSSLPEIQKVWFRPEDKVGICGATSTPKWLLEQVADSIRNLQ